MKSIFKYNIYNGLMEFKILKENNGVYELSTGDTVKQSGEFFIDTNFRHLDLSTAYLNKFYYHKTPKEAKEYYFKHIKNMLEDDINYFTKKVQNTKIDLEYLEDVIKQHIKKLEEIKDIQRGVYEK